MGGSEGRGGGAAGRQSQQAMWRHHFAFVSGGQIEMVSEERRWSGEGGKMDE